MLKFLKYFFYNLKKKVSIGIRPLTGRNFSGKICVYHKGGGKKNQYFFIDFYRRINSFGYIFKILRVKNRSAYIGAIIYENGLFSYIIIAEKIKLGSKVYSGVMLNESLKNTLKIGDTIRLNQIKLFTVINNIESYPYSGSSLIRAAGTSSIITSKSNKKVTLKLKSG
jgi:large subunit ribosomal protein L2